MIHKGPNGWRRKTLISLKSKELSSPSGDGTGQRAGSRWCPTAVSTKITCRRTVERAVRSKIEGAPSSSAAETATCRWLSNTSDSTLVTTFLVFGDQRRVAQTLDPPMKPQQPPGPQEQCEGSAHMDTTVKMKESYIRLQRRTMKSMKSGKKWKSR